MAPIDEAGRLGAVLVQYPFSFHDTAEYRAGLARTLDLFEAIPLAVEFRHASWDNQETEKLLAEREVAWANIDQPRLPGNLGATDRVTAPFAYYRFHGRNAEKWFGGTSNVERYDYLYVEEELDPWISRIREGARRAATKGVYVILNNHFRGQAVTNALMMQKALTGDSRAVPETLLETYPQLSAVAARAPRAPQGELF
jgi:uncharacterized protein YecE (DUF72 family)